MDGHETRDVILDAASAVVLDFGLRRTTMADIARRSGYSRQTVYRYWPDLPRLFAELVTRELVDAIREEHPDHTSPEALARDLVSIASRIRELPLLRRLRSTDPELFSRYVVDRLGSSQRAIISVIVEVLELGQAAGTLRAGDARAQAAMLLLILQSAVQSAEIVTEYIDGEAWATELRAVIRGYLTPPSAREGFAD